jgi:hypothetical protein
MRIQERREEEGPYQCVDHVSIEAVLNTKNVREDLSELRQGEDE